MSQRTMSAAGSFYPVYENEINTMIDHFNAILKSHPEVLNRYETLSGNALIVPHAGWVYSGFTANIAFRVLAKTNPKTVVVIGPSHRIGFEGLSIADAQFYETPMGNINIDPKLLNDLMERFSIPCFPQAHHEHSTEVQMPFIKHYLPDAQVVELVYSYAEPSLLEPIIAYVLSLSDTAVVISTDLSHYYPLSEAQQLDSICLDAIEHEDIHTLNTGCEACGMIGVKAILNVAKKKGMTSTILDYRTSADASGDTSRVVGYMSAVFQ